MLSEIANNFQSGNSDNSHFNEYNVDIDALYLIHAVCIDFPNDILD